MPSPKNKRIVGIYQIKNMINGKIYIGSSTDIKQRWRKHKSLLNKNKHENPYLQNSWNKHTENGFIFEILEYVEDINNLLISEQIWIDKLNVCDREKGYNILPVAGSPLGTKLSEEAKKKMSISRKGKRLGIKLSEETKKKISESHIGLHVGNKNHMYGKTHTEEARRKISESEKGDKNHNYGKKGKDSPSYGKKASDETKKKMSESHKGQKPMLGRKQSEESIKKQLETKKRNRELKLQQQSEEAS